MSPEILARFTGFDWDEGNRGKNWKRHGVTDAEAEEVFFRRPLLAAADEGHSKTEVRYFVLGKTARGRFLLVVFTPRGERIRIISARNMKRKERRRYREADQEGS